MKTDNTDLSEDLLTEKELLKRLRTISRKKFRELRSQKPIPVIRLGHRTYRYIEADVRRAIDQHFTIQEVEA